MRTKFFGTFGNYRDLFLISLICIPLGMIIGAIEVLFGRVLNLITVFRGSHALILTPFLALGGVLIILMYRRFGKGAEKGMSLIFMAGHGESDDIPLRLVPFAIGSTWITHLFGGSAGREGVAVQIGGTVSFWVGKRIPIKSSNQIFLIAGMAAGFAGLFQTPLAAVFFSLEVLVSGTIKYRALLPSLVASFAACRFSQFLGLKESGFALTEPVSFSVIFILKLIALGIIFGFIGGLFAWVFKWVKVKIERIIPNQIVRIVVVGVILSAIFLLVNTGRYSGTGANLIAASVNGDKIFIYDWILKAILTITTLAAGFQGGEVTPLFSIGACLGVVLSGIFGIPVGLAAALGYAAVFGGATNTFLAPVFIGAEVFGFQYLPCFFVVCAVAHVCNNNQSIYGKQKLMF